jgi:uncharacterized protein with HEPN domain
MRPDERDAAYLADMRKALFRISDYVAGFDERGFHLTELVQDAVARQLTVLGEAASQVSPAFRSATPGIPWRQIVGMRNVLVHQYGKVLLDRVWVTATVDCPRVAAELDRIIPPAVEGK